MLLNFARGELVDSVAMKEFLDAGSEGRYISDFPDDELWNHPNAVILPHLGASTEEAEDSAVCIASFLFFVVVYARCYARLMKSLCFPPCPGGHGSRHSSIVH